MKKFIGLYLVANLIMLPKVIAGDCTITSGVVTFPDSDSCSMQPDSYAIKMYEMYFCTGQPPSPTASSATDLSNCSIVFDGGTGSTITMTGTGNAGTFSGATFTRPPNGTYTYGYMLIDNVFTIKVDKQFNKSLNGSSSGSGAYCATIAGSANEQTGGSSICSSSDNLTAGAWGSILTSFGGAASASYQVTAENLNGTGANIEGNLVDTDGYLVTSRSDVDKLVGIQSFASPVVITPELSSINVAFGISEGTTIWETSTSDEIEFGSGPFQAVITAVNFN